MWINLKKNVGDILVYIVFNGFNSTRMFEHKLTKIKNFIFIEDIAFAIFFTLIDPFIDGLFFHISGRKNRSKECIEILINLKE